MAIRLKIQKILLAIFLINILTFGVYAEEEALLDLTKGDAKSIVEEGNQVETFFQKLAEKFDPLYDFIKMLMFITLAFSVLGYLIILGVGKRNKFMKFLEGISLYLFLGNFTTLVLIIFRKISLIFLG